MSTTLSKRQYSDLCIKNHSQKWDCNTEYTTTVRYGGHTIKCIMDISMQILSDVKYLVSFTGVPY